MSHDKKAGPRDGGALLKGQRPFIDGPVLALRFGLWRSSDYTLETLEVGVGSGVVIRFQFNSTNISRASTKFLAVNTSRRGAK